MNQNHIGKTCPYCQFPLKADSEVVVCAECHIPHHRECWAENGGCTTFGCREKSYQSVVAADRLEISFDEPARREAAPARGEGINKLLVAVLVTTLLVLVVLAFAYINLLSDRAAVIDDPSAPVSPGSAPDPGDVPDEPPQTYAPAVIAGLDAEYYIDHENGTIPIGDLPIGARVVDPSWEWEYRLGVNYSNIDSAGDPTPRGEVKPVTWIVVAKDHYEGLDPHVTLLTEELIGLFAFDDSTDRYHEANKYGYNHWGESGTGNAAHGLRPWLNSTGIHEGEGFYMAFSDSFKGALLYTTVLNKEWKNGTAYSTKDYVFITSSTELGGQDEELFNTYRIGNVYAFFSSAGDKERIAMMVGGGWYELVEKEWGGKDVLEVWGIYGNNWEYWTRSPDSLHGLVCYVSVTGDLNGAYSANGSHLAARPALNLKADTLVSEIRN